MYMIRYFDFIKNDFSIESYPCWFETIKRAKQVKEYYKQPVEIYDRKEVI